MYIGTILYFTVKVIYILRDYIHNRQKLLSRTTVIPVFKIVHYSNDQILLLSLDFNVHR